MSELLEQAQAQFTKVTGIGMEEDTLPVEDLDLMSEVDSTPSNAEQIAARNAFTESELTGKPLDETYKAHKFDVDNSGVATSIENTQAIIETSMNDAKASNVQKAALAGDAQTVTTVSAVDSATITPEETFVSTVAAPEVNVAKLDAYAKKLRAGDKVHELIARAEDEKVWGFDTLSNLVNNIIAPGHDTRVFSEVISNTLDVGELKNNFVASDKYFNAIKDHYNFLEPQDQEIFLENLYMELTEESGILFDNPEEVRKFFEKFLAYTSSNATTDTFFSSVDLATYPVAITASLFKTVVKTGNAVVATKLANKEVAAKAIAQDAIEGTNTSGLPDGEAVAAALKTGKNPYTLEGDTLAGAEEAIKKALSEQAAAKDVQDLLAMSGPTGIDPTEYAQLVAKYDDFYKQHAAPEWNSMKMDSVDDTGITYRIEVADPKSGGFYTEDHALRYAERLGLDKPVVRETEDGMFLLEANYKHQFTLDDVSPLSLEQKGAARYLPGFLQFPMQTLDPQVVTTRVLGVHQEDAARQAYERLWKDATAGLTAKQNAKVDIMLKKGDEASYVYKPNELESYGLSVKEQISYYKKRTIRDISHAVHDKALTDRLNFLGLSKITYKGAAEEEFAVAGKTFTEEEAIKFASGGDRVASNIVGDVATLQNLTTDAVREIYKGGGSIVRSANTVKIGGNHTDTFVVKNADVETSRITNALPYRRGEVSRIYDDPYFVSMGFKGMKDGKQATIFNTIRTAPSRKAADKWAKGMNEALRILRFAASPEGVGFTGKEVIKAMSKYIDNPREVMQAVKDGDIPIDATFKTKFDREIVAGSADHSEAVVETLFSTGRLFTSKRNERLRNVFGDDAPIKTPQEAMAQELSYVSRFMNSAVWREAQIEKLLKTFDGKLEPIAGATKYENALFAKPVNDMSLQEQKYLEVLRNHLKTQLGLPSEDAIKFKKRMEALATAMEGKGKLGQWMSNKALGMAHGSVSQSLRTMVFHSYLGLGNLAQFFVQANGALIAAAVHPVYGAVAAKNAGVLRLGVMAYSLGREDVVRQLGKINVGLDAGASSVDDFMKTVKLIKETGVLNSIKSSALHYVKEGAVDLDTHLAAYTGGLKSGIKRTGSMALKAGLIPFNRGEEFARIVAMDVARREWMKANPGKDFLSRGAQAEILARQEVLTLGMSRANVGRMQQGVLSIPFQFAQYNWKLMENLLGQRLTTAEKARVMGMATLLYGSEGMGLTALYREVFGDAELTKEQKLAMTEGVLSWGLYKATGAETGIGTRIGPLRYFTDQITDMASGELTAVALLSGPAGSFLSKEAEFLNEVVRIYNVDGVDVGDKAPEYLTAALKAVSSGFSNTTKYLQAIYSDGYVRSKAGQRMAQLSNLESWLSIMGIKNLKEIENNKMYELLKNEADIKRDYSNALARLWSQYYQAETQSERDNKYLQIQAFMQSIDNGLLENEVFDKARRKLYSEPMYEQNMRRLRQKLLEKKIDPTLIPNEGTE